MKECSPCLGHLAAQFRQRTARLIPLVRSVGPPAILEIDRRVAYVTIELLNAWCSFTRAFFISSALRAYRNGGSRVGVSYKGISAPEDAVLMAMRTLKNPKAVAPVPRYREPSWHPANNIITLITTLGASNASAVINALSYCPSSLKYLPVARNFFAHRNANTADACRNLCYALSIPSVWRPSDVLLYRNYAKPHNVITEWIYDIVTVVDLMVQ